MAREKGPEWMALHKLLYRTLLYTGYTEAEVQRKKRVETIYGKFSGWLASTRAEAEDAVLNHTTPKTTLATSSREATQTPSVSMRETTFSTSSCEAPPSVSTRETTLFISFREATPSVSTRETTLSTSSHEATPSTAPETTLSSLSCEATPSVPAKHGRAPPNTRGNRVTGAGRGNSRGSLVPTTSAERPMVRQVRGGLGGCSTGRGEGTYNVACCYQSTYYALKPNSNPPQVSLLLILKSCQCTFFSLLIKLFVILIQFFFITKRTLPPKYKKTIQLHEAPLMSKS